MLNKNVVENEKTAYIKILEILKLYKMLQLFGLRTEKLSVGTIRQKFFVIGEVLTNLHLMKIMKIGIIGARREKKMFF